MAGCALTTSEYLPQADTVSPSAESGRELTRRIRIISNDAVYMNVQ